MYSIYQFPRCKCSQPWRTSSSQRYVMEQEVGKEKFAIGSRKPARARLTHHCQEPFLEIFSLASPRHPNFWPLLPSNLPLGI